MTAQKVGQTLDGTATLKTIKAELAERVAALKERGIVPGLGTVLVGDDPGSQAYVRGKHADCAKVGITSIRRDLPAGISQAELDATIDELNANPECTGYIVQLPLPKHLDENAALQRIDPAKDADGLHPTNLGRLVLMEPAPLPCTPRGIVHLLRRFDVEIAGAHVVVIGRDAPVWMAAAAIVRSLGAAGVKVRVIELPSLLKATDCYSALPALDGYHLRVGLNDRLVWTTCKAVPVAGQRFNGWGGAGAPFLHGYDREIADAPLEFTHFWTKARQDGLRSEFEAFSLAAMAARAGRVPVPQDGASLRATFGYNIDARSYAVLLRHCTLGLGIAAKEATLADVEVDGDRIAAVVLDDGERVEADLFVDASGPEGRLIGRGNQSMTFLSNPESGRWYHIDLLLDLDSMEVDLLLDGKTVVKDLRLRNCESHSLGSVALTGFVTGENMETYLDSLIGSR